LIDGALPTDKKRSDPFWSIMICNKGSIFIVNHLATLGSGRIQPSF